MWQKTLKNCVLIYGVWLYRKGSFCGEHLNAFWATIYCPYPRTRWPHSHNWLHFHPCIAVFEHQWDQKQIANRLIHLESDLELNVEVLVKANPMKKNLLNPYSVVFLFVFILPNKFRRKKRINVYLSTKLYCLPPMQWPLTYHSSGWQRRDSVYSSSWCFYRCSLSNYRALRGLIIQKRRSLLQNPNRKCFVGRVRNGYIMAYYSGKLWRRVMQRSDGRPQTVSFFPLSLMVYLFSFGKNSLSVGEARLLPFTPVITLVEREWKDMFLRAWLTSCERCISFYLPAGTLY